MGCFHSTNIGEDSKRIDYEFGWVSILEIDEVFTDLRTSLAAIEKLRSGIEDNREALINKTYAVILKDSSFREAIKLMFWILSANHQGRIGTCEPKVTSQSPFVTLNCKNYEMNPYWDKFAGYLKTVTDGPEEIVKELNNFNALMESVEALSNGGLDKAIESMDAVGKARASVETNKNINKVKRQMPKIQRVRGVIEQARMEIEDMMSYIQDVINHADEVGSKAFDDRRYTSEEICKAYHPGPFKSDIEIEELKKDIKKH